MSDSYLNVHGYSTESRSDLQERIGRFALWAFGIAGVMLVAVIVSDSSFGQTVASITAPARIVHAGAVLLALVVWQVCRRMRLSSRASRLLDAALTLVLCISWGMLGLDAPRSEAVEVPMILATTYTLLLRSILVPSSAGRTLWISALGMLPTAGFFLVRGAPFLAEPTAQSVQRFLALGALWCLVAVFTATLNSRQLYGLRRRIREFGKLGQYTLEEKIGEGGMGVVYRAAHAMLRRPAAIKLLLPDRAGERDLLRFEREVQLTSRLGHPNTISIFDYGRSTEGIFYYVMEYLDGLDLERLVSAEGPLEPPRVIHILVQVSGALAEAHALGLVHRDIKPANIILTERVDEPDVVKVVDFGLVRTLAAEPGELSVTQGDAITGTPMNLAPEAITSADGVDARTDLYAVGTVGYFLLTGRPVFDAATVVEMFSKHLLEAPVPPSQRAGRPLPADLEAVLLRCLEKAPERRPASAQALRAELLACEDATRYDAAAARRWWQERGAKWRARPKPSAIETTATMAIDLRGRAGRERA